MTSIGSVRTTLSRIGGAAIAISMGLSGCAGKNRMRAPADTPLPNASTTVPATTTALPNLTPSERYKRAISLMQQGQAETARAELILIQQREPWNRRVSMLLRQIDTDPKQLYGGDSFVVTLQAGDTLFSLAKKYLRDPLNFYGLARFNNLVPPVDLKPGQPFSIPGRVRTPERVVRRPAPSAARSTAAPAETNQPAQTSSDTAAARGEAQRLRAQALEQMSAGSIDRAVTLLSQAASLDPGNQAIARDLARARRIQATVHSR